MRRSHFSVAALIVALAALGGCGDDNKSSDTTVASAAETTTPVAVETTAVAVETTAVAVETTAATAETTVLADTTTAAATGAPAAGCAKADLKLVKTGTLSIGTDLPAFPPWFSDDKPENGRGFESAVAYAVAEQLGFTKDEV